MEIEEFPIFGSFDNFMKVIFFLQILAGVVGICFMAVIAYAILQVV